MMVTIPENNCVNPRKKTIGKDIGIGDDTADDVTGAVAVQIGERQYLNLTDRFCADNPVPYGKSCGC